ncbi:MAG: hypothetical protein IPP03_05805 [Dechloromonas sp.]|jgi:hypothetical protein|nr:hypothetical protein [Candidatus Dechloromonas phosphoritropha]MBP8789697.1 hypothetical protein [Azonexus sp.]MBP9229507.1 hypothetical protein [Azonexus sp.]
MIELSESLKEKMFGDDAILRYIDDVRIAFDSGDRSALLFVVFLCARFQAVIPEWATDALLKAEAELEAGKVEDPNVVFGWPKIRKGQREKAARQKDLASKVLGYLQNHRLAGGGLNADLDFQGVADELEISRRDVEDIYKQHGQFVKDLPRGNPDGGVYAFGHGTIAMPRRSGRPTLDHGHANLDTKPEKPVSD